MSVPAIRFGMPHLDHASPRTHDVAQSHRIVKLLSYSQLLSDVLLAEVPLDLGGGGLERGYLLGRARLTITGIPWSASAATRGLKGMLASLVTRPQMLSAAGAGGNSGDV